MANKQIKTLSDLKKNDSPDQEKPEKDDVNWFSGGKSSGIQVQAPPKEASDIVPEVFKNARNLGAKEYEETKKSFDGAGYRLGSLPNTSSAPIPSTVKKSVTKILTFWKNGFTVDDGPLRRFDDPANQNFLSDINKGFIPAELESVGQELNVQLEDKSTEEYVPPKAVLKPFVGSGQTLGSSSTTTTTTTTAPVPAIKPSQLSIDESKPVTSIQIRLHDGTRLVGRFNHNHTVQDLYSFIAASQPHGKTFQLSTAYPRKVLTDMNATIQEAGLINASLTQSLV